MLLDRSHLSAENQPEFKLPIGSLHSPLTAAAAANNFNKVNALLPKSDVNWHSGIFGNTALHWAIANSNTRMALHLLDEAKGINPDIQDAEGKTPLHLAIGKGWYHFDDELGIWNRHNEPPHAPVIERLIERSDLNLQDQEGNTPLHIAVIRRDYNCVDLLLRKGAKTDVRNRKGQLPVDMLRMDHEQALTFIVNYVTVFTLSKRIWNQNVNKIYKLFGITTNFVIDESLENDEKKVNTPAANFDEAIKLLTTLLSSGVYRSPTNHEMHESREQFLVVLKQLSDETMTRLNTGQLDQKSAQILADQSLILTRKVAYCIVTKADIDSFHRATLNISRWSTLGKILGAFIGAAIGVIVGAAAGLATGLYSGAKGAKIGASLGGIAMGAFCFWAVSKYIEVKQPLAPLAVAATRAIIP
jgi:hypothetical protein